MHALRAPEQQRVELELEQRPRLVRRARRLARLVVDDADRAGGGAVEPVDVAVQLDTQLGQLVRDVQLPLGRLQPRGVLQREVVAQEHARRLQPGGQALGVVREQRCAPRAPPRRCPPTPARAGRRPRSIVRSPAGRSKRRSSTACTTVPRVASRVGTSGSRSTTRNRYFRGHDLKSLPREGLRVASAGRSSIAVMVSTIRRGCDKNIERRAAVRFCHRGALRFAAW